MRKTLIALIGCTLTPSLAAACAYPGGVRAANTALLSILDAGGTVSVHHRRALRAHLDQVDPIAVLQSLSQDEPRRDARAAGRVLAAAQALADGRGLRVEAGLRDDLRRVSDAVDASCSGTGDVASGPDAADSVEQGTQRSTGQGGRPMTYREKVTRLSLTFTIYMTFLAFLLGIRRHFRKRGSAASQPDPEQRFEA